MRSLLGVVAVSAALACSSAGCAVVPTQELREWDLVVDGVATHVVLPAHLGRGLDEHLATYHLRTSVELEPAWRGKDVTLAFLLLPAAVRLTANGRPIATVDDHSIDFRRPNVPHRFRISTRPDERELLLDAEIDCGGVYASWLQTIPRLSLSSYGDRWTRTVYLANEGSNLLALFGMLSVALVFFIRHLMERRSRVKAEADSKNVILAGLLFAGAITPATQLGAFGWLLGVREKSMLVVGLYTTFALSIELARRHLRLPHAPRIAWLALGAICVLAVVDGATFVSYVKVFSISGVVVLIVGYFSAIAMRHWYDRGAVELRWIIGGWAIVSALTSFDLIGLVGGGALLGGLQLGTLALLLFAMLQAYRLALAHRRMAEDQMMLNEELRRKVGDRSRELAASLRRLSHQGSHRLVEGALLLARYRIGKRLGAGAMGEVYEVERVVDGRMFAAKVMTGRSDPEALERFTREAEAATRVNHPHVVRVVDVDVTDDGQLFLVMELVTGGSLEESKARYGDRAFAERVLPQIAQALAAIHAVDLIHRDLKPANVLLEGGTVPFVKVADFGIAGMLGQVTTEVITDEEAALDETLASPSGGVPSATPKLTRTGAIMGTPLYMAPEIFMGVGLAPSVDLFSFGLVAYQVLGGGTIVRKQTTLDRTRLRGFADLAPWLPPDIVGLFERCLDEEPNRRPSAREVADRLARL